MIIKVMIYIHIISTSCIYRPAFEDEDAFRNEMAIAPSEFGPALVQEKGHPS